MQHFHTSDQRDLQYYNSHVPLFTWHYNDIALNSVKEFGIFIVKDKTFDWSALPHHS